MKDRTLIKKGVAAGKNGDFETALREFKPLAEQGYAPAQYNLGVMYADGNGVEQDYKTAIKWYTLAAEQLDEYAQCNLGLMYENGTGVEQDYKRAAELYTLAAEQGVVEAQHNLGAMYYEGQGVSQDYKRAMEWFTLAAEQGYGRAQHNLGVVYYEGQGVSQDYKRAVEWFTLAAEQGVAEAQCNLGLMYVSGHGVPEDYETAIKWYTLAAENGSPEAQSILGEIFQHGLGDSKMETVENLEWDEGLYSGEVLNGVPHGHGTLDVYQDDEHIRRYQGEWKDGEFTLGAAYWPDKEKYIGEFKEGKKHGKGTVEYADGGGYDGGWKENHFHGKGKRYFPDGAFYEGDFVEGRWHGQGSFTWADGESYEGTFSNGVRLIPLDEWKKARRIDEENAALSYIARSFVEPVVEKVVAEGKEQGFDSTMITYWIFAKAAMEIAMLWDASEEDLYRIIDTTAARTVRVGIPEDYGQTLFTMTEEQLIEKYGEGAERQEKIDREMNKVRQFVEERSSLRKIMESAARFPVDESFVTYQFFVRAVHQTVWSGLSKEGTEGIADQAIARCRQLRAN